MKFSTSNINKFLFIKLPAAWWCGVRLDKLSDTDAISRVRFRWINQNPFKSMYFAVQMMAAELPTGVLVMRALNDQPMRFSMLVASCQASFHKRATGTVFFKCDDTQLIRGAIVKSIQTQDAVTVILTSIGTNEYGELISTMTFEWTIKPKMNNR